MTATTPALKKIKHFALEMLTRRDYSQKELALKLQAKGYHEEDITSVLTELTQAGYINEARMTENYIHWRRMKGHGPEKIFMELQARGISEAMIAELLNISDNAWFAEARKVWQKQFKNQLPSDFKTKAKQMRFLQYRGFTREQIESVFNEE
ncbi:MAG: hypothetical protein ACD_46C00037G0001 [uncultured bacterium]|nr:MAG: hypothetical protein ACD_46C00037G0001 [uncultured bacterium]